MTLSDERRGDSDNTLDAFLKTALSGMPDDLRQQIEEGIRKKYATPPVKEMELRLNRLLTPEKAREILYYPSEEDMELYPLLLRGAAPGSPLAEAHLRTQIDALRSLYLCFCRTWRLMKPFIAAGGLSALVDMMVHDNLHVRGQVFEVFLALTDEELYAWHEPPPGGSLLQGPDAPVWKAMLSLASKPLVAHLVQHFDNPFPGAASSAVRILAFHASWLRLHCCRDNLLRMSQLLLDALKKLSLKDPSHGSELARKLHDDFSRFGPASGSGGVAALGSEGYVAAEGEDDDGLSYHVVSSRTVIADPQANESEEAKLQGNDAFRSGNFTAAIQHYSAALDAPVPTARLVEEGERRAVYHTNRAAAYLLRAAAGGGAKGEVELAGQLEGVELGTADALQRHYRATVLDCQQALDLQPCCSSTRFKALWRKSQAEEHLGDWQAALSSAESALTHCRCAGDKSTVQALVHRMQQRLGMLVIDLNEMD